MALSNAIPSASEVGIRGIFLLCCAFKLREDSDCTYQLSSFEASQERNSWISSQSISLGNRFRVKHTFSIL